ncbi:MAG TPA: serine hydrolase domain-containing protein [Thermohalobaculum sp.]|nr:serine hydrolase domain-containing protein [Thermohalobaculum sp.]
MPDLMQGFPPAGDTQVTLANWRKPPFNRWGFQHVRELVPSADIANDPAAVRALPAAPSDLSGLVVPDGGAPLPFADFLDQTQTDALVVLHRGKLVFEHYANGMTAATPHILMSVSKSVVGLLFGILAGQGRLDARALVTDYLPEMAGTAFAGARLRDLLDMRTGVMFDEDYLATSGPIIEYRKATNWEPLAPGQQAMDLRGFLGTLTEPDQAHGRPWHYISVNSDLLGWIAERAAGRRLSDLLGDLMWRPMGAERPAYITVDRLGAPRAAGGICCTARDLARLGLLVAEGGNGAVPADWLDDIAANGDKAAWEASAGPAKYPGLPMRYRSQWYILERPSPLIFAIGVFGQSLFVDRDNGVVIAKLSSQAAPVDPERKMLTIRAAEAVRDALAG